VVQHVATGHLRRQVVEQGHWEWKAVASC
jgi:hypothetical protein